MKHDLCENNDSLLTSAIRPSLSDLEINLIFRDGVLVLRYNSFPAGSRVPGHKLAAFVKRNWFFLVQYMYV